MPIDIFVWLNDIYLILKKIRAFYFSVKYGRVAYMLLKKSDIEADMLLCVLFTFSSVLHGKRESQFFYPAEKRSFMNTEFLRCCKAVKVVSF